MLKRLTIFCLVLVVLVVGLSFGAKAAIQKFHDRQAEAAKHYYKKDSAVTIVEGKRREEIATTLAKAGICSYQDFLDASSAYEGSLFPDTYRFFPATPAQEVVEKLLDNFQAKAGPLNPSPDDLILASIVEREAQNDAERPLIAGVYANRLKAGMTLDADPTVQYAKDNADFANSNQSKSFAFWKPITQEDYQTTVSPYNTYIHTGLPPKPIANPGLESIKAAQNPASHDYYYFLHKDGKLLLSRTLAEHLKNQQ